MSVAFPDEFPDEFPKQSYDNFDDIDGLGDLDFELPADFHVPDDLSELDFAPPPLVHEDEDGNEIKLNPDDNQNNDLDLEAEFKAFTGETKELALLLTPVLDARPLAAVLALVKVGADCIPTPTGAVVVLRDKDGDQPIAAAKLLSQALSQTSILLVTKSSGQLAAERYTAGKCEGEVPAGLLVAGASGVVEDLLVGFVNPRDIPGFVTSVGVSRAKALMWLGATATGGAAPNGGGASSGGRPQRGIRGLRHGRQRPGDTTGRPFGGGAQ